MSATRAQATPMRILLVEDSPGDVRLTQEVLREAPIAHELHVVGDGDAALGFLRGEGEFGDRPRPDLVLLDLDLPRRDGREVLSEIHADPQLRDVPVVVLTGSASEQDVLRAYRLEADAYLTKPIDLGELVAVVRSLEGFPPRAARSPDAS